MIIDDNYIMPFGKHSGKKIANIPGHYLLWLLNEMRAPGSNRYGNRNLLRYLEENEEVFKKESSSGK